MKEINELTLPDDRKYAEDHEWVMQTGGTAKIGISDYAQDQLGDVVFVELPEVGAKFEKQQVFGSLESVKAVSEVYMPIGGEVVAVNKTLEDSPELVNEDPYKDGWIIEIKPSDPAEMESLMTREGYLEMLKGLQ